jgi:hypothetical protein
MENELIYSYQLRWEPLEEKPEPGQWEYAAEYHGSP